MKKILPILVVVVLVLSGLGAVARNEAKNEKIETVALSFSSPIIEENDNSNYLSVRCDDTMVYLMNPGQPIMPKVVNVVELEFGVQNVKVEVTPKGVYEQGLTKKIIPAPEPVPLIAKQEIVGEQVIDEEVYGAEDIFPSDWCNYHCGCGLNSEGNLVTFVAIHTFPFRYSPKGDKLLIAESADIKITYDPPASPLKFGDDLDLVIIAPKKFSKAIQPLVDHKNDHGVRTELKTVEDIFNEYDGFDKPEEIKLFINDSVQTKGIKYVLLIGGLKRYLNDNDRENANEGTKDWHVPIRYSNLFEPEHGPNDTYDPGYVTDLYYADVYKIGGQFDDWDSNDDGIFAAWNKPGAGKDILDLYPDVYVSRLACRNRFEVKIMVEKIITYEESLADPSWFNKTIVIAGDGFQDQPDLNIIWNTNSLDDGEYTIYAQSENDGGVYGSIDIINVTLDKSVESDVTFSEEDHLKIDSYPALPVAEITSPSEGNVLGNTNVDFIPKKAYIGYRWARVQYTNGIMYIRGKSYDPQPHYLPQYASDTTIKVWVNNSAGVTVFGPVQKQSKTWFEGEVETQKALDYMPGNFENVILWPSNGNFTSQQDAIDAISEGSGFLIFAGHGNPNVWANHNPGIPGGRANSSIYGLKVINHNEKPLLPMYQLKNGNKLPVCIVGGCHNSQFNVSILKTLLGPDVAGYWTHGAPIPECWSWWLTRKIDGGTIATIGMSGLGYGALGDYGGDGIPDCIQFLGGWINSEFFKQYAVAGHHVLGETCGQTITSYINRFGKDQYYDVKTVQAWVLLGDPSLMLGGYGE